MLSYLEAKENKTPQYVLKSINKYRLSPKGKETRRKYIDQNKGTISEYNKKYQKQSKMKMKSLGYCLVCRLRPGKIKKVLNDKGKWVNKTLTLCEVCSERQRMRRVSRRNVK
jgi:hypothetical protein